MICSFWARCAQEIKFPPFRSSTCR